mmetsp:Transcript_13119/g.36935  ORF Transcript_13119/g.36935 Transcript_13119/m.36935 type:complete len:987 (+) Transcript_13119:885-3845(+)
MPSVILPPRNAAFSPAGLKSLAELTVVKTDEMAEMLKAEGVFEIGDRLTGLTFDVIGSYVAGLSFRTAADPGAMKVDPLLVALDTALTTKNLAASPVLGKLQRKRWRSRVEAIATLHSRCAEIIEDRLAGRSKSVYGTPDVLDLMLTSVDKETGETMDLDNVRKNLITFMLVGHDSTSSLLTSLIYVLTQHPDVENRLREEVMEVIGKDGSPTQDNIKKLTFMTSVIKETLRLYPPAAAFIKICLQDTNLGPYRCPKGTKVVVSLNSVHRNPKHWLNPEEFDPSRFLPGAPDRHPYSWLPFSSGPRACLGMQFALIEARVVLARLLQSFTFRLHKDARVAPKYRTFMKLGNVVVTAHPLNNSSKPDASLPVPASRVQMQPKPPAAAPSSDNVEVLAAVPKHGAKMSILYGSNMGTCKALAERLQAEAGAAGFEASLLPLDKATSKDSLTGSNLTLIVTSTYNGLPPENARKFAAWTATLEANSLTEAKVAILGVGNSNWKSFQAFPIFLEGALTSAGAAVYCQRGAADEEDDLESTVASWGQEHWPQALVAVGHDPSTVNGVLAQAAVAEPQPKLSVVSVATKTAKATSPQVNPTYGMATMRKGYELQEASSDRSTRHVEVLLPEGVTYSEGDHLAVIPHNHPEVVLQAAELMQADLGAVVQLDAVSANGLSHLPLGCPVRVADLLTRFVDLQAPASATFLRAATAAASAPDEADTLAELAALVASGDFQVRPLEVLHSFRSVNMALEAALPCLAPMRQRYYSISSSPRGPAGPRVATITVGLVEGTAQQALGPAAIQELETGFVGVASGYLTGLKPGQVLEVTVVKNDRFRLPQDPSSPVIMIGPGTGLAPFRGFLQALQAEQQQRHAMLFFGCRTGKDFIYRPELEAAQLDGTLSEMHVAFSRVTATKVYVQDLLWEARDSVWELLQKGATVYVCGDARNMAKDVDGTLVRIAKACGEMVHSEAEQYIHGLSTADRYVQDVWAN